jgi:hypothetical protein
VVLLVLLDDQRCVSGAFGRGFLGDLAKGGPTPLGAQKANLSAGNLPYMEEVALNEQVLGIALSAFISKSLSRCKCQR